MACGVGQGLEPGGAPWALGMAPPGEKHWSSAAWCILLGMHIQTYARTCTHSDMRTCTHKCMHAEWPLLDYTRKGPATHRLRRLSPHRMLPHLLLAGALPSAAVQQPSSRRSGALCGLERLIQQACCAP